MRVLYREDVSELRPPESRRLEHVGSQYDGGAIVAGLFLSVSAKNSTLARQK